MRNFTVSENGIEATEVKITAMTSHLAAKEYVEKKFKGYKVKVPGQFRNKEFIFQAHAHSDVRLIHVKEG